MGVDRVEDFGDPQSVQTLSEAARRTAADLQQLIETVNKDVMAVVPDLWGGEGATSFQRFSYRLQQKIAGMGSPLDYYSQELADAATTMRRAKAKFEEAQRFAQANGITIMPDLSVQTNDPNKREALARARQMIDDARQLADQAQQKIRRANEILMATWERSIKEMLEISAAISGAGAGRRPGRRLRPGVGGPRVGPGSGRRRRGTPEEESQMLYGPEGKVRLPAEGRGRWVNEDGTPGVPGDSIFVPNNPREFGIHPLSPRQDIKFVEGVPDLRSHAVRFDEMPRGWGADVPHIEGLPLTGARSDAGLADAVAGRQVGMTQEQFRVWREERGFVWHHYSFHELTLVPNVVHAPLAHQGPFK